MAQEAPELTKFLVCALFHGDFPALAARCSASLRLLRETGRVDMRIGLNAVSPASQALLRSKLPGVETLAADPQFYKYPMMRRLVHGYSGDASHLMWFDDDSCLLPGTVVGSWLDQVTARAASSTGSLGSTYTDRDSGTVFSVGGWFVLPLGLMRRFDWPPPELVHNGGDVALGALLHRQGLPVTEFRDCVVIDADASLRESTAPRRGFSGNPPAV
jgi:hypothetical protein